MCSHMRHLGEQGWCSVESAHLPAMWPGSIRGPGVICGLCLLLEMHVSKFQFDPGMHGHF